MRGNQKLVTIRSRLHHALHSDHDNNPVGYHTDVTAEMFVELELADIPNLHAIKESSANTRRITEISS